MAASISAVDATDEGAPQVGITVSGLHASNASLVVVTVSWDGGGTWNAVRGGTVVDALGSTFVRDHVSALNIESTYRAVITGGSDETVTTTITVTSDTAWIQDPLAPRTAVPISVSPGVEGALFVMSPSLNGFANPQAADMVTPLGGNLPVASVGQALKFQGLPLRLQVPAAQGSLVNAMRNVMQTAGQLVVRGLPDSLPVDAVAHVIAVDRIEDVAPTGVFGAKNAWSMTLSQTRPTSMRLVIPWWTYDQVKALIADEVDPAATYDDVIAAMPAGKTYTEWVANPGVAS